MQKLIYISIISLCLCSCKSEERRQSSKSYFSVADFFSSEIRKLNAAPHSIRKTVDINNSKETKTIKISDWKQEFKIFTENDINKPSWDGAFTITQNADTTTYTTENVKIPVKLLQVVKAGNEIKSIEIITTVKNYLYSSSDTLQYYPDSLYRISNQQNIRLLKTRNYQIVGQFLK